jgi:uncharacterized protein with von Willebrand factor type A (vWA) domain
MADHNHRNAQSDETARAIGQTGNGEAPEGHGAGLLIASPSDALTRADLRTLVTPEAVAEAERVADRLARAIRYRLSRRRIPNRRGEIIDLRARSGATCRAAASRWSCGANIVRIGRSSSWYCSTCPDR